MHPAGHNPHRTRNLIDSAQGDKFNISVSSADNVVEYGQDKENYRACILEINPDVSHLKVYVSGLRNPVGMDWNLGITL